MSTTMPAAALTLVGISALLHAIWNFYAKRLSSNLAALWVGFLFGSLVALPMALTSAGDFSFTWKRWGYVIVTSILQAAYLILVGRAYRVGDMSFVYPLARGAGVLLTVIFSALLLGDKLTQLGNIALATIFAGSMLMSWGSHRTATGAAPLGYAWMIGLLLALSFVLDKVAVTTWDPVKYIFLQMMGSSILLAPFIFYSHRRQLREALTEHRSGCFIIGTGAMMSYLLVLMAFQMGSLPQIIAVREVAVVLGAFLGVFLLGERISLLRALGIAAITGGNIWLRLIGG